MPSIMATLMMRRFKNFMTPTRIIRRLFFLDTDEGLRRNMMRTTLEIITTYIDNAYAAENLVIGARLIHLTYEVTDDFDLFFQITRDVIAEGCADIWSDAHTEAWNAMLKGFEKARV